MFILHCSGKELIMRNLFISIVLGLGIALGCACGPTSQTNKWTTISSSTNTAKTSPTVAEKVNMQDGYAANLPVDFTQPKDEVGRKLLKEYGSVFVAKGGVTPPSTVVFKDEMEVVAFQKSAASERVLIGGVSVELQATALKALKEAISEAGQNNISITPRGTDASKRSYQDTVGLWESRVNPALAHWSGNGRISAADAQRIRSLSPYEQVPEVFKLEAQGIYFSKDLSKSIIYSVAPPGSSQHLSMLALDVTENENSQVRSILAKHGWFQTVVSDLPHFTFLGVTESELPKLGLKKTVSGGRNFWVPDL